MNIEVQEGDVLIRRTTNGWYVQIVTVDGENETFLSSTVHQDKETDGKNPGADSLANVLWEHFSDYFRSKWSGGLVLEVATKGHAEEEIVDAE